MYTVFYYDNEEIRTCYPVSSSVEVLDLLVCLRFAGFRPHWMRSDDFESSALAL